MDELVVHELFVPDLGSVVSHDDIRAVMRKPLFPLLNRFLTENQLNCLVVIGVNVLEIDFVFTQI